ncbi:cell envelope integrity protein TolA [Microbulbifer sp. CNSA002]|uniref:cell envelope integrity protein TolA n=1 Tax=unclassified Microbulbifer TaxID=2619833 RepID=UPI0039B66F2A
MKILVVALSLSVSPFSVNLKGSDKDTTELMNNIVKNCKEIPALEFPRPEVRFDWELKEFNDHKRWIMRDLEKLESKGGKTFNLKRFVTGKSFSEVVSDCKRVINITDNKLAEESAGMPGGEAQEKINQALWKCEHANKWIDDPEKFNANYDSISDYYNGYKRDLEEAKQLDSRVSSWKKQEIESCNQVFEPKYLALKEKVDQENSLKRKAEEKKQQEQQRKAKEAYAAEQSRAKSLGYKGVSQGITSLIYKLSDGYSSISEAKSYLVEQDYTESYKVVNIIDDYVIYGHSPNDYEYIQVAVTKQPDRFYSDGAPLPSGYYAVQGMTEFVSVAGATKQIIILNRVSE